MDNDLISRKYLKEQISELYSHDDSIDIWLKREDVDNLIDNAPAVSDRYEEGYAQGYIDGSTGADWKGGADMRGDTNG